MSRHPQEISTSLMPKVHTVSRRSACEKSSAAGCVAGAGKWNKHVDGWDCLKDQEFPSLEAFAFTLRQMLQAAKPPHRYTPEFLIFKKFKDWEIQRCSP